MTVAELLISLGVAVKGAKEAEKELGGVAEAAEEVGEEGGASLRDFAATGAKAFAAVGAAAIAGAAAVFKMVDSVTAANDEIIKGAKVAGLGTDEYQRLSFAAQISGTNIKNIEIASKNVARGLNDAATKGTGPLVEGLELVGLRLEDVQGLPFEKQLGVFSDAINRLDSDSDKLAASALLLGSRAGPQLATLLAEGSDGISALGNEAESLGGVISESSLEKAAEFQDALTELTTVGKGFLSGVVTELIPLTKELVDDFKEWALANKGVVAEDIKGFIKKTIPVLKDLLKAIGFIVKALGSFIDIMGGVGPAVGLATTALIAFKLAMSASLGPIGAIGLAIGALISIVAGLVSNFGDMNDELEETQRRADKLREREQRNKPLQEAKERAEKAEQERSVQKSAEIRSEGFESSFQTRQQAGARVRDELSKRGIRGRKADKLVSEVITGKTDEAGAISRVADMKRSGGGGRRKKKKEPESDVTLAESLLAIRTGTADPKQLKQVIQQLARKTPSSKAIKPTVAIDFFNFQITQNFRGTDPTVQARESAKSIRSEFDKGVARAAQSIPQSVVR